MAVAASDTLSVSKDLQQAGIHEKHAEAIALAVKQGQGDLATKQDIALLKSDIDHLDTDINQSRSEMKSGNVWMKWAIGAILALSIGIIATVISRVIVLTPSP